MRTALTRAYRVLADCLGPYTTGRDFGRVIHNASSSFMSLATRSRLQSAVGSVLEQLEPRQLMSTYYVNLNGNDNNSGTSTSAPWKSIGKVNSHHMNPGDSVLFEGGQTFSGSLRLFSYGGSATDRVTLSSYGSGRATISSGTSTGAWALNVTGMTFNNLNFVGSPGDINGQDGIRIESDTSGKTQSAITVENCSISGYAQGGIIFGSDASNMYLSNVSLTSNTIYNCVMTGIQSYAVNAENNTNIYIGHNIIHNIYGNNKATVTGSGIQLQGLNGATVEYNDVYDNGLTGGNGNVGIWCYQSNKVVFQYNTVTNTRGLHGDDGDAYDFDADTSNSIMQYNYAGNNDGSGFMLGQWWNDNNETGDIVRYNVAQDNGQRVNYSGIDVWGKIENAQIYNNTVYAAPSINGQTSAIRISNNVTGGLFASNIKIANNVFVTTGNVPVLNFYSAAMKGATGISFTGNVYYSYSGTPKFDWGGTGYTSLAAFQAGTGQEKLNGSPVGAYENPDLINPGNMAPPAAGQNIFSSTAYNLASNTPIKNVGVSLDSLFGYAVPLTGSSTGKTIPGIDQHLAGTITTSPPPSTPAPPSTPTAPTAPTTPTSPPTSTSTGTIGNSYLSGWDIGNPNKGSNTISGTTNTVTGGGTGLGTTSDSFRYAFTTLTGDGEIVAQISSLNGSGSAAAGLMVRSSTAANSAAVSLVLTNSDKAYMLSRSSTGATPTMTATESSSDKWIKVVRIGNTISTYLSSNGSSWSLVGSSTVELGATVDIGLAVTSQSLSNTATAVFKNVSFSGKVS